MLILRRREGESLIIGDQINVSILGVDAGGAVSLGISAPRDMLILRSELQQAAHQGAHTAALVQDDAQILRPLLRQNVLPQGLPVGLEDGQGGLQLVGRRPGKGPLPLQLALQLLLGGVEGGGQGVQLGDGPAGLTAARLDLPSQGLHRPGDRLGQA